MLEALFGIKTAFARTPKYAVGDRKVKIEQRALPAAQRLAAVRGTGGGRLLRLHDGVRDRNLEFPAVPFLLLFVVGYWWAGFSTLYQEYQGKVQWQRERALALEKEAA